MKAVCYASLHVLRQRRRASGKIIGRIAKLAKKSHFYQTHPAHNRKANEWIHTGNVGAYLQQGMHSCLFSVRSLLLLVGRKIESLILKNCVLTKVTTKHTASSLSFIKLLWKFGN